MKRVGIVGAGLVAVSFFSVKALARGPESWGGWGPHMTGPGMMAHPHPCMGPGIMGPGMMGPGRGSSTSR